MGETRVIEGVQSPKLLSGRRTKLLIGGAIIALVVGYLIFTAAKGSAAYYLTVQEVQQEGPSTRNVRVAGNIVGESVVWEPRNLHLEFDIVDDSGQLHVVYSGSRPDMFRDGAELVIEGKLTSEDVFAAHTMVLKCPSKYEEAD